MKKTRNFLASVVLCLTFGLSVLADDGETGAGNFTNNLPASGSENTASTANSFQFVINNLIKA